MMKRAVRLFCVLAVVSSGEAQTIATSSSAPATEIATSFGSLLVDKVEIGDKFPPGCRTSAPDCSPAKPGNKVLTVWLKAKGDADEASRGLMNLSNVYVKSDDGQRTDNSSGGMMNLKLFVAFTPPVTGKAFVLHWDNNPPISLVMLPPRSAVPRLASSPRAKEAPAPSRPAGQDIRLSRGPAGESANWAIAVVEAERKYRTDRFAGEPQAPTGGKYLLRLSLRIRYRGPAGEFEAPTIAVTESDGTNHALLSNVQMAPESGKFDLIFWFLRSGKKQRLLQSGEDFGPWVAFWFGGIPAAASELQLTFADVAPLKLRVPRSAN